MDEADAQKLRDKIKERDAAYEHAHEVSAELWDLVKKSGMNVSETARFFGVERGTVYNWRRRNSAG